MKLIQVNPNNAIYYSEDFVKGFECGAKRQLEADQKECGWIPCSERLPECNGRYLVTNEAWGANEIEINVWKHGEWYYNTKPIAWMPLPEPYREEQI